MKKKLAVACAAIVTLVASVLLAIQPASAATGFYVSNGRLFDANDQEFVMRGVSHPYAWYKGQNSAFANIKRLGANTVRVVLDLGVTSGEVTTIVNLCRTNRLICMLEIHSTTGLGDNASAATLAQAADWWVARRSVLVGQERYVLINIGNEPIGNNNSSRWTGDTRAAIQRLRNAGFTHTLVVDGPNWGQDWSGIMRTNAASIFASDSLRNTVFSIHMYGVYGQGSAVTSYLNAFLNARLPIVVGEFGNNHSDGDVDENTIMSHTQANRIGYIGWSWSGNGSSVGYLDMTNNFNPNSLTTWGQRIFNGANGIRATSREASVFSGTNPGGPTTGGPPPVGSGNRLRGAASSRCLDVPGASTTNGTRVNIWDCGSGSNQSWVQTSSRQLQVYGNKCLDASGGGTVNGTPVIIWDCGTGTNQQWTLNSNGSITNVKSGLCLDVVNAGTANGSLLNLWSCSGAGNQRWARA
ncbi:MAG TPA: ricin-type beta-trefoil lectin domain protein [Pilimelia sp.]|nr:ricin-type beta-trefoil lectin domain protein [Pilimelia sp.]